MYMHIMYVCVIVLPVGRLIFDMALIAEDKKLYYADFNEKTIVVLSLETQEYDSRQCLWAYGLCCGQENGVTMNSNICVCAI